MNINFLKFRMFAGGRVTEPMSIEFGSGGLVVVTDEDGTPWSLEFADIMQFTGQLDYDSNEIYTGDILRNYNGEMFLCVQCENGTFEFEELVTGNHVSYIPEKCVVIGNMFESPELIGDGDDMDD